MITKLNNFWKVVPRKDNGNILINGKNVKFQHQMVFELHIIYIIAKSILLNSSLLLFFRFSRLFYKYG